MRIEVWACYSHWGISVLSFTQPWLYLAQMYLIVFLPSCLIDLLTSLVFILWLETSVGPYFSFLSSKNPNVHLLMLYYQNFISQSPSPRIILLYSPPFSLSCANSFSLSPHTGVRIREKRNVLHFFTWLLLASLTMLFRLSSPVRLSRVPAS